MSNLVFDESSSNREASHGYAWWFSGDTFEKAMAEDRKPRKRGLTRRLVNHPGRLTIFYFLTLAALSTTLLMTPIATPKDETTTFTTAFFTAVSAISTCGISIVNSTTHWTTFGQGVLIFAVQMGWPWRHDVRLLDRIGREPPSQGHAAHADRQRTRHYEAR